MEQDSIHSLVRQAEQNYIYGTAKLGEYVDWSMYKTIETIFAYLNSKHTSGSTDSLGREKPFFNIVTAAVNIWYRATDIDKKDINVRANDAKTMLASFLATIILHDWMKRARFGQFLNEWGRTLAQYNSAIVKCVDRGEMLDISVVPWNRYIADPVDFDAIPGIEKFYFTPAQLRKKKGYNQDVVEELIKCAQSTRKTLQGINKDSRAKFIEVYEVHGELEKELLTGKETDSDIYVQQMHAISFVKQKSGKYKDFDLYGGREKQHPYMITHLLKEDGRTLGIGAVELLFDAQWMQNHSVKNMKDTLDLSSKLIFQTADANYVDRNVLTAIESGDILVHAENKPLTQVNNGKGDVASVQNFAAMWRRLAQEITSTPDAIRGNTLPSGTPYQLGQLLTNEATSLFEVMTENKGLALDDILRTFVIPYIKRKLKNKKVIASILSDHNIQKIDSIYVPKEAVRRYNAMAKEQILNGQIPSPFNQVQGEAQVRAELAPLGNQRFFDPGELNWDEVLKDLEWELDIDITSEGSDKKQILATLTTMLQTIAQNPAVLQDPNAKLLFSKVLSFANVVSPVELSTIQATPTPTPTANPSPGGGAVLSAAGQ